MSKDYLLGIGVGTASIKVGIFTVKGQLRSFTTMPFKIINPELNYCEASLTIWWNELL